MARHRDTGVEVERGEPSRNRRSGNNRRSRGRVRVGSDFTYISGWVKYTMFMFNFLFWIMGVLLIGIGVYAVFDKWRSGEGFRLENVYDVIFNLAFILVIIGFIVAVVSFAGCIGALRENLCLLKFYSFCLLLFFLVEMALAALGFIFPHKVTGFLEGTLSDELIRNYRDDLDFQNLIDLVQKDFECCGISSDGHQDWKKNIYFNCNSTAVESCGVPFSCCKPETQRGISDPGLVNIMCGFGVQKLPEAEISAKINTEGCIKMIQRWFEQNLYTVGGIALGVALAQLLVIWLSRTLEGQIENQMALWKYS